MNTIFTFSLFLLESKSSLRIGEVIALPLIKKQTEKEKSLI